MTSKEKQVLGFERVSPIIFEATTRSDDREQYDKVLSAKNTRLRKPGIFKFSFFEAYHSSSNALHDALQNTLARTMKFQHNFNYINPGWAYR